MISIFSFKVFLNEFNFIPYTEDPDTTYKLIRRMCTNKNIFIHCKNFIDLAQGISLPLHKVRNAQNANIRLLHILIKTEWDK